MKTETARISETDLHAYVDGHLTAERRAAVEAWLAARPEQAAAVQNWQRQNEALTALFPTLDGESDPGRAQPASHRPRLAGAELDAVAAAAVLLVGIGAAAGWMGRDLLPPAEADALIASAMTAHSLYVKENRHAVEVAAADRQHLVSWLSNRVDRPIDPPDLTPDGFSLVGGRLLPGYDAEDGPAAQLMYENGAAERVTVYITAAAPDQPKAYEFTTRANSRCLLLGQREDHLHRRRRFARIADEGGREEGLPAAHPAAGRHPDLSFRLSSLAAAAGRWNRCCAAPRCARRARPSRPWWYPFPC